MIVPAPIYAAKPSKANGGSKTKIILRNPQPGDMGWVVQQHGAIYCREYGFNTGFEALVARIVAAYIDKLQPEWERCWIAEINGKPVGCTFVVRKSKTVAKLRLVLVTPAARGLGLGGRMTDEAIIFARSKGYKKMVLWTQSNLIAARAIYASRGFRCVAAEANHNFGQDLVSESWELRF